MQYLSLLGLCGPVIIPFPELISTYTCTSTYTHSNTNRSSQISELPLRENNSGIQLYADQLLSICQYCNLEDIYWRRS